MFNRRLLTAMSAVTLLVIALAVWLNQPIASSAKADKPEFIAELKTQRDAINSILIQNKQQTLTLQLRDQRWQLVERDGFVANNAKIRELLKTLTEAKIAEVKTSDPARYSKLGVEDNSDKGSVVTVKANEQSLASFIVGNSVTRPAGHYVRRVGEAQSLLLDRELHIGREVRDWIDSEIINLPAAKINKIERLLVPPAIQCVRAPCEAVAFSLLKQNGSTEFSVADLPATKEMQPAHIVSGLSDVMNGLSANDVVKADTLSSQAGKQTVTRYYSDDKQIVTITYTAQADKHYVALTLATTEDASAEIKVATEKLSTKLSGWAFEINSYKGEGLARGLDDLTQKKESKK